MRYRRLTIRRHPERGVIVEDELGGEGRWMLQGSVVVLNFGWARQLLKDWLEHHAWEGSTLVVRIAPPGDPTKPKRKKSGVDWLA